MAGTQPILLLPTLLLLLLLSGNILELTCKFELCPLLFENLDGPLLFLRLLDAPGKLICDKQEDVSRMRISIVNDFIVLGDVVCLKKEKLLNCHKLRQNLFSGAGQKVESQH